MHIKHTQLTHVLVQYYSQAQLLNMPCQTALNASEKIYQFLFAHFSTEYVYISKNKLRVVYGICARIQLNCNVLYCTYPIFSNFSSFEYLAKQRCSIPVFSITLYASIAPCTLIRKYYAIT